MGLRFEGETIEDETLEEIKPVKRRRRLKKPALVGIILAGVLAVGCVAWVVIQRYFPNLTIGGSREEQFIADTTGAYSDWTVIERISSNMGGGFAVQLPAGVNVEDIAIENHYRDRALLIRLSGIKASDFAGTCVTGDVSDITVVAWKAKDSEILISFQMSAIWEYEVTQEGANLLIKNTAVQELYDTVVVIDPIYVQGMTEDVTALVAESVAQYANEQGIKVYITRGSGTERTEAERLALVLDTEADYVIELNISSDTNADKYGLSAVYNDRYFSLNCDNVTVADTVLKAVATTVKNRANSIEPADEGSLLMMLKQPSAGISIGYSSNTEEYALLMNANYRDALAIGIYNGIAELVSAEQ